jgi:DNA modification methylase
MTEATTQLGPYLLGPNDENQGVYAGDARQLSWVIPDESISLVFTDPIYDRIDDYRWLAETSARVLKPDSACVVWCSKVKLSDCQRAMEKYLNYQTTLFYTVMAKNVKPAWHIGIMSWTTPCLVFAKGRYKCEPFLVDTWITSNGPQSRFAWQKNTPVSIKWIDSFNKHRGIVVDPFTGSGSFPAACKILGMPWLAFEIDPQTAEDARQRVRQTQLPLPGLVAEQPQLAM